MTVGATVDAFDTAGDVGSARAGDTGGARAARDERWTLPYEWDVQVEHPRRPVVGVSWYEAQVYSCWLREHRRPVTLAESESWTRAATRPDGPYPWGAAAPSPDRVNFDQHVGCATAVGTYPLGAGIAGHRDLAGNVWEWCRDAREGEQRVVRGAGWYSRGEYVVSAYAYHFHARNRFHDLGFRLESKT